MGEYGTGRSEGRKIRGRYRAGYRSSHRGASNLPIFRPSCSNQIDGSSRAMRGARSTELASGTTQLATLGGGACVARRDRWAPGLQVIEVTGASSCEARFAEGDSGGGLQPEGLEGAGRPHGTHHDGARTGPCPKGNALRAPRVARNASHSKRRSARVVDEGVDPRKAALVELVHVEARHPVRRGVVK